MSSAVETFPLLASPACSLDANRTHMVIQYPGERRPASLLPCGQCFDGRLAGTRPAGSTIQGMVDPRMQLTCQDRILAATALRQQVRWSERHTVKIRSLDKMRLCERLCCEATGADTFEGFRPVLELIAQIVSTDSSILKKPEESNDVAGRAID